MASHAVGFFKLHPDAIIPTRGTPLSAGWDLYALEDVVLWPDDKPVPVRTGVGVTMPAGCYGRIAGRSGLALQGVFVGGGVIDRDYQLELKVILTVSWSVKVEIKKGQRIAQLIFEKYYVDEVLEVEAPTQTSTHVGFGSTGV